MFAGEVVEDAEALFDFVEAGGVQVEFVQVTAEFGGGFVGLDARVFQALRVG